jgi:hypothetical protein
MKRSLRRLSRSAAGHTVLAAACVLYACLPLSGCDGGTSSEVGNPSITLEFRHQGKPMAFTGYMWIVAAGSNPEFYYSPPNDGTTPPVVSVETSAGFGPSTVRLPGLSSITLSRSELVDYMFQHDQLRLLMKTAAQAPVLRDFNVILQPAGSGESLVGWLTAVHPDSLGYHSATGDSGKEFVIELTPGHKCTGQVDPASPAGKPLALFVPGSPYYALVHGGRFEFVDLPAGRLPLRWVTGDGRVFAVPESLGLAGGGETPLDYSLPGPVHAGERIDSIPIPDPNPVLSPPAASPAGQYTFSDSIEITLTAAPGASIYYSLDGSTPTQDGKPYDKPLILRSSATLKAVAYAPGFEHSGITVNNYVLAPARPVITPGAGSFVDSVQVRISGPDGSAIHYTLDGSMPTEASRLYTGDAIVLRSSALVQAVSSSPGLGSSAVVASQYVIVSDTAAAYPTRP